MKEYSKQNKKDFRHSCRTRRKGYGKSGTDVEALCGIL